MESQRIFILVGLMLVSVLLYQEWQSMYGPQPITPATSQTSDAMQQPHSDDVPAAAALNSTDMPIVDSKASASLITMENDVLRLKIDPKGGDVVSAELLKFPIEQDGEEPVSILHRNSHFEYIAQSGLIGNDGPDASPSGRPNYSSSQSHYEMSGDSVVANLTFEANGMTVIKRFILNKDSYVVQQDFEIINNSGQNALVQPYMQLKQTMAGESGSMMMPTYRGPAYSTSDERYSKYTFDDLTDKALNKRTDGGWVGMLQHYFVSAWVPTATSDNLLYTNQIRGSGIIGAKGEQVVIPAGQTTVISSSLFVGPKDQERLSALSPTLNLTVDYGFLWWLAQPLHWLLTVIQGFVVNWGLAIIVVTIVIKTFLYPLTKKQYESMGRMRVLQPKVKALQERYGEDKQKMQQAMMELYKKEKVNPLGGCLPLLLQMPIFIALYWVLLESVELRHAGFMLWITDLSVQDPYYVLPLLMGASMFLMQKLSPTTVADPMQQKVMMFMPVLMTFLFITFPAGLVLYWVVSNLITIAQQTMINRALEKKQAA
ncbi:membrane protein insertase YidC [Echinimonas agarilytica]|uniref:Membrane protein insertase YidC n=1 Tax=Echinimonas agarilytica TaxID=1215918 RepID=A0AA41W3G3_9GAMM|nr:membrane protein insertase YidC [Echinimonas agarilytica]MCM2678091.1 membrane protein insertase YidC [Echinimonas agarilytica]